MILRTTLSAVEQILHDQPSDVQETVFNYLDGDMSVCNAKAVVEFYKRFACFVQQPSTVGSDWTHISGADAKEWEREKGITSAFDLYCDLMQHHVYIRDSEYLKSGRPGLPFYDEVLDPVIQTIFYYSSGEVQTVCGKNDDMYFACTGKYAEVDKHLITSRDFRNNIFKLMLNSTPKTKVQRDPLREENKLIELLGFTSHDWEDFTNNQLSSISPAGQAALRGWYHLCGQELPV